MDSILSNRALRALGVAVMLTAATLGCERSPKSHAPPPPTPLGSAFDPAAAGRVAGRVIWQGDAPDVEPIRLFVRIEDFDMNQPNPNAPRIDSKSKGVAETLVHLRGVDPKRSKPWHHPPVEVVFSDNHLAVVQQSQPRRIGIARRGDEAAFVSHEKRKHIAIARGAAFFSLPLLDRDAVTRRALPETGIVDLTSGSAFYWMRAYLWVSEHPYAAITDADGRFELTDVPAGEYELVAWRPNWRIKGHERHPEFGAIERLNFGEPAEKRTTVRVAAASDAADVRVEFSASDFP